MLAAGCPKANGDCFLHLLKPAGNTFWKASSLLVVACAGWCGQSMAGGAGFLPLTVGYHFFKAIVAGFGG